MRRQVFLEGLKSEYSSFWQGRRNWVDVIPIIQGLHTQRKMDIYMLWWDLGSGITWGCVFGWAWRVLSIRTVRGIHSIWDVIFLVSDGDFWSVTLTAMSKSTRAIKGSKCVSGNISQRSYIIPARLKEGTTLNASCIVRKRAIFWTMQVSPRY